jgi:dipeptidyl-peptidase-4
MKKINLLILIFIFLSSITFSQENGNIEFSLETIYGSREFSQPRIGSINWFNGGKSYTKLERSETGEENIVKYDTKTGESEILINGKTLVPGDANKPLRISSYEFSSDLKLLLIFTNTKRVWRANTRGDYWIVNLETNNLKKLGGDAKSSTLMFATLSPNNRYVGYVRENNIFIESVMDDEIIQLTKDGSETIINGTFDWVYEEELNLRNGFRWSPDGNRIAFWQLDAEGIGVFNMINNTDSIYSQIIPVQYPKVGTTNSASKVGVVEIESKEIKWFKVPGDPRNNYIARMDWAESSDEVIIQQLNRLQNENRVYLGEAETGNVNNIFTDKDDAWVEVVDDLIWFKDGKYFTWLSEKDGWNQVYLISRDGKEIKKITGEYDVVSIAGIDKLNEYIYFISSPENATQRYLYRKSIFNEEEKELLTPENISGYNTYDIAPNFDWAIHNYSTINSPNEINLISLPNHNIVRNLLSSEVLSKKIAKLNINPIEFFKVSTSDGVELDGWKIVPPNFDESKKYPVIFYVYGEPASQTVLDRWMRSFFWHQLLAKKGYIVVSVDNRGTPAPRGREFRKCVYGQIGILASSDQADATKVISDWEYIDKERIGIWGWSGGGSMSLNAIFRYPDLYKTAIAVAPVGDQKLYDTIYQERYMGLLSTNPDGYRDGSPVNFAQQLKGNLLLIHGTGDDNVHYQNTEVVINKLIENNKLFSVMPYPNRSHGIHEGFNTYLHVYSTMLNFWEKNL